MQQIDHAAADIGYGFVHQLWCALRRSGYLGDPLVALTERGTDVALRVARLPQHQLSPPDRLQGESVTGYLDALGNIFHGLGNRTDRVDQSDAGSGSLTPQLDNRGAYECQIYEGMLARVGRDELLILPKFTAGDEPVRQVLGAFIELARRRQGKFLARAEQCAARSPRRQELLHLRRKRPGIEQSHHRGQSSSRTLT